MSHSSSETSHSEESAEVGSPRRKDSEPIPSVVPLDSADQMPGAFGGKAPPPQQQRNSLPMDDVFEGEEMDYDDLEGVGIVVAEENAPATDRKAAVLKFILPEKGRERSYWFGIVTDCLLLVTWLVLIFTLLDAPTRQQIWYMPLLGIVGATVAVATPAGGGIFYFPALTALKVSPLTAISFNFGTQFTGMGIFGAFNWIRKSRSNVIFWMNAWFVLWGWIGSAGSLFLFPINNTDALRIIFAVFCVFIVVYVLVGLKKGNLKLGKGAQVTPHWKNLIGMAVTGLLGGVILGWISVGIDIGVFFVLTLFWGMDSRRATVSSILVIGWSSLLPLITHMVREKDQFPYKLWLMVAGGSIIGARLGPLINKLLGKTFMLILFVLMLVAEILHTIVEYAILPAIH